MDLINNSMNTLLHTALSASSTRQKTITNNIANVDTPNYKAKKTIFSHELNSAIDNQRSKAFRTDHRHLEFASSNESRAARVIERNNTQVNNNGNNVDIDIEMAELAKNQIYYNALVDRMNGRFNSIKTVLGK